MTASAIKKQQRPPADPLRVALAEAKTRPRRSRRWNAIRPGLARRGARWRKPNATSRSPRTALPRPDRPAV